MSYINSFNNIYEKFHKLEEKKSLLEDVHEGIYNKIKNECPGVEWKECYATLGRYDFMDIIDAEDPMQVEKAIMMIRDDENFNTALLFAIPLKSISVE